jgi:hypothetical protein
VALGNVFTIDGPPGNGLGDFLPCDEAVAIRGIDQVQAMLLFYNRLPTKELKDRFHGDVQSINESYQQARQSNPSDLGWINCTLRDLGGHAEAVTEAMASASGQSHTAPPESRDFVDVLWTMGKWALGLGVAGLVIWGGVNIYRSYRGEARGFLRGAGEREVVLVRNPPWRSSRRSTRRRRRLGGRR